MKDACASEAPHALSVVFVFFALQLNSGFLTEREVNDLGIPAEIVWPSDSRCVFVEKVNGGAGDGEAFAPVLLVEVVFLEEREHDGAVLDSVGLLVETLNADSENDESLEELFTSILFSLLGSSEREVGDHGIFARAVSSLDSLSLFEKILDECTENDASLEAFSAFLSLLVESGLSGDSEDEEHGLPPGAV